MFEVYPDRLADTLSQTAFGELPTAVGPAAQPWCPEVDAPKPVYSSFDTPDGQIILQRVQVHPAPGVIERAVAADLAERRTNYFTWGQITWMLWGIAAVTLSAIAVILWSAR